MKKQVVKRESYHTQVYEIIKSQIVNQELVRGEKINENALAQALGVSRSPIREALRMLEQDELVVQAATGLIVNPLHADDLRDFYECRMILESYAAGLGMEAMTEETLSRLESYVTQAEENHNIGDMDKVVEINTAFHNEIIECCQNRHLKKIIANIYGLTMMVRTQEFSGYRRTPEYLKDHAALVEAMKQRDKEKVESLMRHHIYNDMMFSLSQIQEENG